METLIFTAGIFVAWIASVCLHEFGHAIVAYWGGDTSVKDKGYLTLNPVKYTDVQLSLVLPLIFLLLGGIPLPGAAVYINMHKLRNRWWKSGVSAAGPLATLLVAVVLATLLQGIWPDSVERFAESDLNQFSSSSFDLDAPRFWLIAGIAFLLHLQVAATVLNLLPIPPLDGYGILRPWLPLTWQTWLNQMSRYGFLILFALLWLSPEANQLFWSIVHAGSFLLLGNTSEIAYFYTIAGYIQFQDGSKILLVGLIVILIIVKQVNTRRGASTSTQARLTVAQATSAQTRSTVQSQNPRSRVRLLSEISEEKLIQILAKLEQKALDSADDRALQYHRILILRKLNRFEETIPIFNHLLDRLDQPTDQPIGPSTPLKVISWGGPSTLKVLYEKGLVLSHLNHYPEAIATFEAATTLDPDFAVAWYEKGLLLLATQYYPQAIIAFDRVIEQFPEFGYAPYRKGICYFQLGQFQDALTAFDFAIFLKPEFVNAWFNRGLTLFRLEAYDRAILAFNQVLDRQTNNAQAYYNKACCFAKQGKIDGGIELLKIALSLQDNSLRELSVTDPDLDNLRFHPSFQQLLEH